MARALFATALAQALVAVIALLAGLGSPWSPPVEIFGREWVLRRAVCRIGVVVPVCSAGANSCGRRAGGLTRSYV
jgi:hypothetical protein